MEENEDNIELKAEENTEFMSTEEILNSHCPEGMKSCLCCGVFFTPVNSVQKYCDFCKGSHNNARTVAKIDRDIERHNWDYNKFMPRKLYDITCKNCGKVFQHPRPSLKEFCSAHCRNTYIQKTAICANCGKNLVEACVIVDPDKYLCGMRYYCSPECKREYAMKNRYIHTCKYCGKEYNTLDGKGGQYYCSQECMGADRRKGEKKKKKKSRIHICPICGKEFTAHGNAVYCSDACRAAHQKQLYDPNNENSLLQPCTCVVCGKIFEGRKNQKYCSAACRTANKRETERKKRTLENPRSDNQKQSSRKIDSVYVQKTGCVRFAEHHIKTVFA